MGDAGCFWMSSEFHDATILLSSDLLLLEQTRSALQETLTANPKKRKAPASKAKSTRASKSSGPPAPPPPPAAVATGEVLTLPVHRIVLSLGSAYFKTAISTLIGDSAAAGGRDSTRPVHPIIVVHEEDVEAAQGVLQFLYTKTLEDKFSTARDFMQLLVVSGLCLGHV